MLENLTYDDFRKLLNQKFTVVSGEITLELQLVECRTIASPLGEKAERQAFTLLFQGPLSPVLQQSIRKLEGGPMGPLEIFIVPVGPDAVGMRYEAIFT